MLKEEIRIRGPIGRRITPNTIEIFKRVGVANAPTFNVLKTVR